MFLLVALLAALAGVGIAFTLFAAVAVRRFARAPLPTAGAAEPVTLLKPLHGDEPRLRENLASFLDQAWPAPIQMIAGIQRADDPAGGVARGLVLPSGDRAVEMVVDATPHGANAKVANLLNMAPAIRHDVVVLSDSDMAAPRHYLQTIVGALQAPGVGAVTCAYVGRGDAGFWSDMAAAGISYQFLPQLLVGLATGLARPGMGSTIALRRGTLDAIGGFAPFADVLADDHAMGEAVRALGLAVVVPPLLLTHGCPERSLAEVWRHELRWAATILRLDPGGQAGTIVTHPLPLALLLLPFAPALGGMLLLAALGARLLLRREVDRAAGHASAPGWLLPLRDGLSFAVFLAAFFARRVDWRGARLAMAGGGRISARQAR